jgi:hypothetical protein
MAKVEILKVGHALVAGTRGDKGGAPSKDSIWGLAFVGGGTLVKFFGRRGGVLRFKTEKKANLPDALAMFEDKLAGKGMDYNYTEVSGKALDELVPNLAETVSKGYYAAAKAGKLNNRATAKKAATAA